ncbi:MAG TPA: hypothetical protein VKP30_20875 [Polyangiaceae bacterium]|nr:hypothetical protein [Polyangiaceae bacterium]
MSTLPRGLLVPFRRDRKSDFASASGEQLLASKVRQALLTEGDTPRSSGELPWRTAFGGALTLLRFQGNDAALRELARVYVAETLRRWVPGASLEDLQTYQRGTALWVTIRVTDGSTMATVSADVP